MSAQRSGSVHASTRAATMVRHTGVSDGAMLDGDRSCAYSYVPASTIMLMALFVHAGASHRHCVVVVV
eukprot:14699746-Alexandrium_andersonii.AAC.1